MKPIYKKLLIFFLCVVGFVALIYITGINRYITLEHVKMHSGVLSNIVRSYYITTVSIYSVIYAAIVASSLPMTGPLSIAGGFMFGFWPGLLYSLIAGLLGAMIAFLLLKRMTVSLRSAELSPRMTKLKKRFDRYGYLYLLMLHFTVFTPFIVINTLAAFVELRWRTFVWMTLVGMIPATAIYVFAGTQLASIESLHDLFSWPVIFALVLLIVLLIIPIVFKKRQ